MSFWSCQNNENELAYTTELPKLSLDHVIHLVAQSYFESTKVIYRNENNIERVFNISVDEKVEQRLFENKNYKSEKLWISITAEEAPKISFYISGYGNYTSLDSYVTDLTCGIFDDSFQNYTPSISLNIENPFFVLTTIENEVELLGNIFQEVFTHPKIQGLDSYSELFYTVEKGIIGFRDQNNELWVLDRYEE